MKTRELFKDPKQLFWVLHIGGWAIWGLFGKFLYTTLLDAAPPGYASYVLLITLIGMLLTLPLRYLYRLCWDRVLWQRAAAFLGGSAAVAYLWISTRSQIYMHWFADDAETKQWLAKLGPAAELYDKISVHEGYISSLVLILAWSTLYFAIKYYRIFGEVRESALKSAAMAHEAQLKMLRYQLNPHFLFNTLNAISTLILEQQTELANGMIGRLSNFLRHSLDNDPMQKSTLRQEIETLRLYLDIEKLRFEDRLRLDIDLTPPAERGLIPSLLLQPLVENAIKYAVAASETGGTIAIAARVFAGDLLIEVRDDGPGATIVEGRINGARGVGLSNTRERLSELYDKAQSFRIALAEPSGLAIHIRVPFETE